MNRYEVKGNLGKDPVFKQTPTGKTLVEFSVATSDGYGDKKQVNWHNIVAWEKTAEQIKGAKKGDRVHALGMCKTDSYEDRKTGEKKYKTYMLANEISQIKSYKEVQDSASVGDTSDHYADVPF